MAFNIEKYMGTWYELIHYPSFFQRNDNYNTKAVYTLENNIVNIVNSTIVAGEEISSMGKGKQVSNYSFRVDFEMPEIAKLGKTGQFNIKNIKTINKNEPNYIINHLWLDNNDDYIYAVVTDLTKNALYVLSRTPNPLLIEYNIIMKYVIAHFDRDKLVQTPHLLTL